MTDTASEPLAGGHDTEVVVRVGDTVRRSRGPRSDYAAEVLRHLEAVGYAHAPRHLGVDDEGRDVLTYLPGRTTDHPTQRADGAYARAGAMLRELHDLTTGHPLAGDRECVVHGDPGPFNTIVRDGLPVAFIDWSACRPGDRLDDLGYLAWTWCVQTLGAVPIADQAAHLRELRDGYGDVEAERLVAAVLRQQTRVIDVEGAKSHDTALTATRRAHARDAVAWATADRALVRRHEALLLSALRR
ncbi:aminoglycoside phosphotransferase family protein [Saccharothrix australiensis]|uniref:aminoglycoside phosphotransferase family protein n=1 Tax=Saccharothrix australiensis TaxID=2072 RepID=UPI000EB19051|nr:aminoglycoside phosphotransferase family protein [Saccharothrix australiensis]